MGKDNRIEKVIGVAESAARSLAPETRDFLTASGLLDKAFTSRRGPMRLRKPLRDKIYKSLDSSLEPVLAVLDGEPGLKRFLGRLSDGQVTTVAQIVDRGIAALVARGASADSLDSCIRAAIELAKDPTTTLPDALGFPITEASRKRFRSMQVGYVIQALSMAFPAHVEAILGISLVEVEELPPPPEGAEAAPPNMAYTQAIDFVNHLDHRVLTRDQWARVLAEAAKRVAPGEAGELLAAATAYATEPEYEDS